VARILVVEDDRDLNAYCIIPASEGSRSSRCLTGKKPSKSSKASTKAEILTRSPDYTCHVGGLEFYKNGKSSLEAQNIKILIFTNMENS